MPPNTLLAPGVPCWMSPLDRFMYCPLPMSTHSLPWESVIPPSVAPGVPGIPPPDGRVVPDMGIPLILVDPAGCCAGFCTVEPPGVVPGYQPPPATPLPDAPLADLPAAAAAAAWAACMAADSGFEAAPAPPPTAPRPPASPCCCAARLAIAAA